MNVKYQVPTLLILYKCMLDYHTQKIRLPCLWNDFDFELEIKTYNWMRSKINFLMHPQEPLLATVERRKLTWFGHVINYNSLSKTILQGTMERGVTPRLTEEILDGQCLREDIPDHAITAHNGLFAKND